MGGGSIETLAITDLFALAEHCKTTGRTAAVPAFYKRWIAHHPDDPSLYAAYFNYGTTLNEAEDHFGAILAFREATRLKPDFHPARINLGLVLEKIGQKGTAVSQWMEVSSGLLAVTGEAVLQRSMALENIGRVLEGSEHDQAAEDALHQRLELGLDDKVIQHWIALRMRQCKWPALAASDRVKRRDLLGGISPLSLATLSDDPMLQLATAFHYHKQLVGLQPRLRGVTTPEEALARPDQPLRIGYVSSDLRDHAVGFSVVEMLELHDRRAVDVHAYYCGIDREDPTKARIRAAVDHWCEASGLADGEFARRIQADRIDILVDLNGYTKDAQTKVFATRPAPICVNWFGFPSSMGSPYHHYIIADDIIIPPSHERYYSEAVVRLPCYQPNDRKRVVAGAPLSRRDEGLPDGAVVYCCLNGLQKLTAATFDRWLTILAQVPDSVLWLLGGTAQTQGRLRQRAAEREVAPQRLVFAHKKANPDHVARYALADLFLDTMPYGAHTTAADALWMGVPVITLQGRSFASRVCSSLVHATGLDDLICRTPDRYVSLAIELGRDRNRMARVKRRLAGARDTGLLFDTPRLVSHLEGLYRAMWADFTTGALPVPDLTNLDIYREVGMTTDVEHAEALDDTAYEALYHRKLADYADSYPVGPDLRMRRAQPGPALRQGSPRKARQTAPA